MDCLVDGVADARVPSDDRGLRYGDALFETVAFRRRQAPLWNWHWQRLQTSCERLGMAPPVEFELVEDCRQLTRTVPDCVIRLTWTRGSGGRGYWPDPEAPPRRIVERRPWPTGLLEQRRSGLALQVSPQRLAIGAGLAGIKHGNRLEQVLAARVCSAAGFDEAVMLDAAGRVAEAISANLLLELDGEVIAPEAEAGVAGVGLAWLLAQPEVQVRRAALSLAELDRCEGLMVINSVAGIRPARALDGRPLSISDRCRQWQALWDQRLG